MQRSCCIVMIWDKLRNDAIQLNVNNLTWAKRKHCRSSWLNSGRPEADCFSSALTDPETATCQSFSADADHSSNKANEIRTGYSIMMQKLWRAVPYDQSQLHSSRHSIQIWSHLDFWIESVDKARQQNADCRDWQRTKDKVHPASWSTWDCATVAVDELLMQTQTHCKEMLITRGPLGFKAYILCKTQHELQSL